jgi:hypothetical protein
MASLHLEPGADCEDIGAVEDVAGARRIDDGNRICVAPLQAAASRASSRHRARASRQSTRQLKRARLSSASSSPIRQRKRARLGENGMIRERQQPLENLGVGDIAIEHRRNAERARLAEQRAAPSTQRGSASTDDARATSSSGSQSAASGKAAEIHDLPLAGSVDDDPGDEERPSENNLKFATSIASASEAPCISCPRHRRRRGPRTRRTAEPRHSHGSVRRHAAAERRIFQALDLLALPGEEPFNPPDLVERGEAKAYDPDAPGPGRDVRQRYAISTTARSLHRNTWPLLPSNKCVFPGCGRRLRRSPTFGRNDGSIRAIADAPARSKMNQRVRAERFDELDADRNAVSRIGRHREVLGTNSEHAIAGLPQPAATLRIQRHGRPALAKTPRLPRATRLEEIHRGEPMNPATNWLAGRS